MEFDREYSKKLLWILLAMLLLRLVAMWLVPLTDTTEARYAEIARKMLETHNWVTPQYDYGVPFWAKPPLSTWASAISMKLFGVNEFASRLPSLLCCLGLLFFMYSWLKEHKNNIALLSVVILSTSILFFGSAGMVMTDPYLIFSSTLAMVSFWKAVVTNKAKIWGYVFFVSLAIGLLAKGPLILVLVGLPTGIWTLLNRQLNPVWLRLPWVTGLFLTIILAAPWYYIAEQHTPGFLRYFIVGEHFSRFLISGWKGDMYGHAHSEPLGMIWLFLALGFIPWIGLVARLLIKNRSTLNWRPLLEDSWLNYLLLWSIMPIIFFSFAHNIISPYALPAMPASAILMAEFFVCMNNKHYQFNKNTFLIVSTFIPTLSILILTLLFFKPDFLPKRSEKYVVGKYLESRESDKSLLVYYGWRVYSAEFYTAGKARAIRTEADIERLLENDTIDFLAIDKRFYTTEISSVLNSKFVKIGGFQDSLLYKECGLHDHLNCRP